MELEVNQYMTEQIKKELIVITFDDRERILRLPEHQSFLTVFHGQEEIWQLHRKTYFLFCINLSCILLTNNLLLHPQLLRHHLVAHSLMTAFRRGSSENRTIYQRSERYLKSKFAFWTQKSKHVTESTYGTPRSYLKTTKWPDVSLLESKSQYDPPLIPEPHPWPWFCSSLKMKSALPCISEIRTTRFWIECNA